MATPAPRFSLSAGGRVQYGVDGSLIVDGARVSNATQSALWRGAPSPNDNDPSRFHTFFDDFLYQASATASETNTWTLMNDGVTGTNAFQNASGGIYNIVTAAAQDDYNGIRSVSKSWLFEAGKELWLEARLRVSEASTNKSAWLVGLTDTVTTGGLQTGSSGPLASYDGAVLWKDEGSMAVNFETSKTTTQNTTSAIATSVSNTWTKVGFYFDGATTTGNVTPYVDIGSGWVAGTTKQITLSGLGQMYLVTTVKAGAGGNAETLQLDYIKVVQVR